LRAAVLPFFDSTRSKSATAGTVLTFCCRCLLRAEGVNCCNTVQFFPMCCVRPDTDLERFAGGTALIVLHTDGHSTGTKSFRNGQLSPYLIIIFDSTLTPCLLPIYIVQFNWKKSGRFADSPAASVRLRLHKKVQSFMYGE
jgi:hypothetical protein